MTALRKVLVGATLGTGVLAFSVLGPQLTLGDRGISLRPLV